MNHDYVSEEPLADRIKGELGASFVEIRGHGRSMRCGEIEYGGLETREIVDALWKYAFESKTSAEKPITFAYQCARLKVESITVSTRNVPELRSLEGGVVWVVLRAIVELTDGDASHHPDIDVFAVYKVMSDQEISGGMIARDVELGDILPRIDILSEPSILRRLFPDHMIPDDLIGVHDDSEVLRLRQANRTLQINAEKESADREALEEKVAKLERQFDELLRRVGPEPVERSPDRAAINRDLVKLGAAQDRDAEYFELNKAAYLAKKLGPYVAIREGEKPREVFARTYEELEEELRKKGWADRRHFWARITDRTTRRDGPSEFPGIVG